MKAIVGSTALEYFDLNRKEPKDIDVWYAEGVDPDDGDDSLVIPKDIFNLLETDNGYCTPDTIYTIKCSHLGWDIHWEKTKLDIIWLQANKCKLMPELYMKLVAHWKTLNGNKDFLSLSQDKREFFNDHVTYIYDHDYLHELVAYPNDPTYRRCLKDGEEVLLDKDKFNILPVDDKISMFREEMAVIAIERWLVNPVWKGRFSVAQAHDLALKKTIVSLTKNWATDFIVTNIDKFFRVDLSYFKTPAEVLGIDMSYPDSLDKIRESFDEVVGESFLETISHDEFWGDEAKQWAKDNKYELIEQEGGGEGGSEWCHSVFKFGDTVYKINYGYRSHYGYDFQGAEIREVKPVQKTITVYE